MASQIAGKEHYHAVIDMGSNGIRFSITDLSPPTSRILPTLYQDRCGISLYDVQYQAGLKVPIPDSIIEEILIALLEFKRTCQDFGVEDSNIQLVATEATRNAINSREYLQQIEEATGWKPQLLSKEDEGRLGAMGIASSINDPIDGLVMDMGGGSIQLTWMEKSEGGQIGLTCFKSYPYGAAALMAHLSRVNTQDDVAPMAESVSTDLKAYFEELRTLKPAAVARAAERGLSIFLSGGGFRSWGHILMSLGTVQPYPIPIVNGFTASGTQLMPNLTDRTPTTESHRISSRRGSQVPAIQFLMKELLKALGSVSVAQATFCQGGVREGLLYESLSNTIRSRNALDDASVLFAPRSASALVTLLSSALPECAKHRRLIPAVVNLLYYHDSHVKDIRAAAALRSTTTGILAKTHGISHYDRAILALILCERWGGEADVPLSDRGFLHNLEDLEGATGVWWARYVGSMANCIAKIYPAGLVREPLVNISAQGNETIQVKIMPLRGDLVNAAQNWAKQIQKLGKKKHWVSLRQARFGMEIDAEVVPMEAK